MAETMRISLVEDNPDVRQSIRMQLERLGHLVTEAKSAPEALDACEVSIGLQN